MITRLEPFGCEVRVTDPGHETVLDTLQRRGIDFPALLHQHDLVVIPSVGQVRQDARALCRLASLFGSPVDNRDFGKPDRDLVPGVPSVFVNSNRPPQDRMPPEPRLVPSDPGYPSQRGWHHDQSFEPLPPVVSLLYGHTVTPQGGETAYANTRLSRLDLDLRLRSVLQGYRDATVRHVPLGFGRTEPEVLARRSPTERCRYADHPLVETCPLTGEPVLFVSDGVQLDMVDGPLTGGPGGAHGHSVIEAILAVVTRSENVYTHVWEADDVVIHNNYAVAHCPTWFDHVRYDRVMWRVTVEAA